MANSKTANRPATKPATVPANAAPVAPVAPTTQTAPVPTTGTVGGLAGFNAACAAMAANGTPNPLAPVVPATKPAKPRMGVAPAQKTRAWAAGVVIANAGHATGVTQQMVTQCGVLYGTPNEVEDAICLRNAWHAIRGYHGGTVPLPNVAPATANATA